MIEGYAILTDDNTPNLMERVLAMIKDGWIPQGGVSVTSYMYPRTNRYDEEVEFTYCQAMIKEE